MKKLTKPWRPPRRRHTDADLQRAGATSDSALMLT
jgi:hypothetical protein